jgi:hypothetical protein
MSFFLPFAHFVHEQQTSMKTLGVKNGRNPTAAATTTTATPKEI